MQATTAKKLARFALGFTVLLAIGAICLTIVLKTGPEYDGGGADEGPLVTLAFSLVYCVVGGIVAINRPGNLVGWSMMFSGSGILVGGLLSGYAEYALLAHTGTNAPLALEAQSLGAASWTFLMSGIFFLLVLFPSGRPSSKRWTWIARFVGFGFVLIWFTITTAPADYDPPFAQFGRNRLAFHDYETLVSAIFAVIFVCLFAIAAAGVNLFLRFLRSSGLERAQFKWLAICAIPFGASIPFGGADLGVVSQVANVVFGIGLFLLPISVGIAVTRYHLYDIDRILNRTLVYAILTTTLALTYIVSVLGLERLLRPLSGGNDLAIAVTTLMVAAAFLPARQRIQQMVNRRFNRRAYDAQRTVDDFSTRLRDQVDLDTLRYELLAVLGETMQPARASLWLRELRR